jgi:hypothetical protein
VPDLHDAGGDEHGERSVQHAPREVAGDHDQLAWQPVGQDATEQDEDDDRQGVGAEDQADVGRVAGQPVDEQARRRPGRARRR